MQNFIFYNPVCVHFGKGQIAALTSEIPTQFKVLMTYGGGSIKKNGVYDQVMEALKSHTIVEFPGIEPNPTYETCMKAVEIIRKEGIDYILSVGGGSVLDGSKFMAAAAKHQGEDPWDIVLGKEPVQEAVPLGCVLTLPATGSEMNGNSVISRSSTGQKRAFGSSRVMPQFSILDPETTFSLPKRQVANGVADAYTHVLEQYLTYDVNTPLQDRWSEGVLLTLIEEGRKTLDDMQDYEARANFMWAATMALNGILAAGVVQDWATHMIGHELTALYGIDHARTLAIVMPSLMEVAKDNKRKKLLQYGSRVFGITEKDGDEDQRVLSAIEKTRQFYESLEIPTRFSAYKDLDIKPDTPQIVAKRLSDQGLTALGEKGDITPEKVEEILALCA
ncbi:MAG: iron-containing alcohol dehydrogenase [Candidatus Omnitrophica bacterium]|nr:iron-containing alcohol dehydrogenase [Candidatus Omnitrophota bacterium]